MQKSLVLFATVAALAFILIGVVPREAAGAATPAATNASAVTKEILGQGASAVAPDRVLILQRRTFAPGSDSGSHPAPGPAVLFVDSGCYRVHVDDGAALLTRTGETASQEIARRRPRRAQRRGTSSSTTRASSMTWLTRTPTRP